MTDAHCHLFDLIDFLPDLEGGLEKRAAACAASSWNLKQFEFHKKLAKEAQRKGLPALIQSFGIHPQLPSDRELFSALKNELLRLLEKLPAEGRLGAIGETGFDLFDQKNRETEKNQDELFLLHIQTAVKYSLPLVIHARRAMHKIFPFSKDLKKLPAVIFHSWPGTCGEGEALIRRGINVFFSFGAAVVNNHREAIRCAAAFPADRLLLETDAPYQPVRGRAFSSFEDLPVICRTIAALRKEAGLSGRTPEELEAMTDSNFFKAFSP
ncbi:MAG: TatD family hydrolase [Treponema sp.]|jgi:TatD DNase family protein|nr:TatD family hydrolase [Treponema sp.]